MRFVPTRTCPPAAGSWAWTASATPTPPAAAPSRPAPRWSRTALGPPHRAGGHGTAVHGGAGEGDREDQGRRQRQEADRHQRHRGPHGPQARSAPGDRAEERLQPERRAAAAVPLLADGGFLRHQQRHPRGRPAADPGVQRSSDRLCGAPHHRGAPAHRLPPGQEEGPPAPGRGPPRSRSWTSTRSSRSSVPRTRRPRPGPG